MEVLECAFLQIHVKKKNLEIKFSLNKKKKNVCSMFLSASALFSGVVSLVLHDAIPVRHPRVIKEALF